jgi:hypothetical protein
MQPTSLRIGVDMDGVLADFASAFREVEARLFGPVPGATVEQPEEEEQRQERGILETRERLRGIWREIQGTEDFWRTLKPLEPRAVARLQELSINYRWEVFFITQRPPTAGDTVQRQTQRWLVEHGFELPSVLALTGSRGAAVRALRLDYHLDDSLENCLDALADSTAKIIHVSPDSKEVASSRKLGIACVSGVAQALDILERATLARSNPSLLQKLSSIVGWRL